MLMGERYRVLFLIYQSKRFPSADPEIVIALYTSGHGLVSLHSPEQAVEHPLPVYPLCLASIAQ
jgi:hypothetical protein